MWPYLGILKDVILAFNTVTERASSLWLCVMGWTFTVFLESLAGVLEGALKENP